MALPEMIEIVPLTHSARAEVTVPGSKSITNRALILAALASGPTILRGALWSEDTQVMVECLRKLGFTEDVALDPEEFCNRTISVEGRVAYRPPGYPGQRAFELGTPPTPRSPSCRRRGTA